MCMRLAHTVCLECIIFCSVLQLCILLTFLYCTANFLAGPIIYLFNPCEAQQCLTLSMLSANAKLIKLDSKTPRLGNTSISMFQVLYVIHVHVFKMHFLIQIFHYF